MANRPAELKRFLETNEHMQVEGLVEVISGLSADNTSLVENLCGKLETTLAQFYERYRIADVDPHSTLEWTFSEDEEKSTWKEVTEHLASGPAESGEVDEVERLILSERRSKDQAVVIRSFNEAEQNIGVNQDALISAINNAVEIDGQLKVRAVKAILDSYAVMFQIGVIFAPINASRKYFTWNGMGFVNRLTYSEGEAVDDNVKTATVLGVLPRAVADRASREMGSKKLGEIYSYLATRGELTGLRRLLNFSLVLTSKPNDWPRVAGRMIEGVDRKALYLRYMLATAMKQFREDVNTNQERALLKRVIVGIQARRQLKKGSPNATKLSQVIKRLEKINFFRGEDDEAEA